MLKTAFVIVFTALLSLSSYSQPSDSLLSLFNIQKGTEQIETGISLCNTLTGEPEQMLTLSFSLLEKNRKLEADPFLTARVLRTISDAYYYSDSIERSNEYLLRSLALAESVKADSAFIAEACNDIGLNYNSLEKNHLAFEYLNKAVEMFRRLNLPDDMASAMSNLATVYFETGQFKKAISLYDEVYRIDLSTGNTKSQATSLNNLGRMYVDWGKYGTGIEFYKRSAALLDTVSDREILAVRYNNIGLAYQLMGDHGEAIRWINRALKIDTDAYNAGKIGIRLFNLATSYMALNDLSRARNYLEQSEKYFTSPDLPSRLTRIYGRLGELYQMKGDLSKAETYYLKTEQMADRTNAIPEKAIAGNYLYNFYKLTSQPEKALKYLEMRTSANDSLYKLEAAKQIEELETRYQTEKKESEIVRLEAENELRLKEVNFRKRERNLAFGGLIILCVFLIGLNYLYVTVKKQKRILAEKNAELDKLNQMKNRLFGIISHDLRNVSAAYQSGSGIIQYHLEKGQPEKLIPLASEIGKNARNLSSMLDNLLEWALLQIKGLKPDFSLFPLNEEFILQSESLNEFCAAKSNRVEIISGEEVVWCDRESFRLILRNLLFNALKFTAGGLITLKSWSEGDSTFIEVSDTGCGIPPEILGSLFEFGYSGSRVGTAGEKGTGLGLQLVHEHVSRNNGTIGVRSEVDKGTAFTITLPNKAL